MTTVAIKPATMAQALTRALRELSTDVAEPDQADIGPA